MQNNRTIDPAHQATADAFARQFGVNATIHPADFIYWFDYDNADEARKPQMALHYAEGGRATAHIVRDYLNLHQPSRPDMKLLDFASGYGRVTRWFKEVFPEADIYASDIHPEAVEFMQSIGLNAIQSTAEPEAFNPGVKFDAIWVLSFFTHLPKRTFQRWLVALSRCLNRDGLFIFTTHGISIWPLMGRPPLDAEGFHFNPSSEQKDLSAEDYGNNCATPLYVLNRLRDLPLHLESLRSPGIGHHDVWILRAIDPDKIPKF